MPVRNGEAIREDGLNFMGEHEAGSFLLLGPRKRRWIFSDKESETFPLSLVINHHLYISLDGEGCMELKRWNDVDLYFGNKAEAGLPVIGVFPNQHLFS